MRKYLICYEIGMKRGVNDGHIAGHAIVGLSALTTENLNEFAKSTKAETAAIHKEFTLANFIFRSVTRLDE